MLRTLIREGSVPPKTDGILESSLYVSDVSRSARFYEETFGFRVIAELGELRLFAVQIAPEGGVQRRRRNRAQLDRPSKSMLREPGSGVMVAAGA